MTVSPRHRALSASMTVLSDSPSGKNSVFVLIVCTQTQVSLQTHINHFPNPSIVSPCPHFLLQISCCGQTCVENHQQPVISLTSL